MKETGGGIHFKLPNEQRLFIRLMSGLASHRLRRVCPWPPRRQAGNYEGVEAPRVAAAGLSH